MRTKTIMGFLFGFFIIGFVTMPVSAEVLRQITITPSPTFIPPSITPTTYSYACPVGTPLGWGTYTPSPLWQTTCGACASLPTSTIVPTSTIIPLTGTAMALTATSTITPSPSPTVTPTRTATPVSSFYFGNLEVTWNNPSGEGNYSCTSNPVSTGQSSITCSGNLKYTDASTSAGYATYFGFKFRGDANTGSIPATYYYSISYTGNGVHNYCDNENSFNMSTTIPCSSGTLTGATNTTYFLGVRSDSFSTNSFTGVVGGPFSITVQSYPLEAATATPTLTPTTIPYISTYCSSVAPQFDDFGFDLFQPEGEPNCAIGWDEFGVGDYTMPAAQICLQPSKFGVIRLFAIDYEVGVYGLVAAAAFFYRFFRTA
jgi:hypothetical protein